MSKIIKIGTRDSELALSVAFQGMKFITRQVHVLKLLRSVQSIQQILLVSL